jgi:excisionase family DNA binding protein
MRGKRKHQRTPPTGTQGRPYSLGEAARLLAISPDELRSLIVAGSVPAQRNGRRYVIDGAPILALMAERGVAA